MKETVVSLVVYCKTDADAVRTAETLARAATGFALDGSDTHVNIYQVETENEEST